jgi:hypothetical protein
MRVWILSSIAVAAIVILAVPGSMASAQQADTCGNQVIDVPDSGPAFDFNFACAVHDDCYEGGGSEEDRTACDDEFLANMRTSCDEMWPGQLFKRYSCYSVAITYFLGVRIGGWAFWDYT